MSRQCSNEPQMLHVAKLFSSVIRECFISNMFKCQNVNSSWGSFKLQRMNSQTAIIIVWGCCLSEEGHSSASSEFIPSVYEGKALPASQTNSLLLTNTAVRFDHLQATWVSIRGPVHIHYLPFFSTSMQLEQACSSWLMSHQLIILV